MTSELQRKYAGKNDLGLKIGAYLHTAGAVSVGGAGIIGIVNGIGAVALAAVSGVSIAAIAAPAIGLAAGGFLLEKSFKWISNARQKGAFNTVLAKIPEGSTLEETKANLLQSRQTRREAIIERHHQRFSGPATPGFR